MAAQMSNPESTRATDATRAAKLSRRRLLAVGALGGGGAAAAAMSRGGRVAAAPASGAGSKQEGTTEIKFWKPPHNPGEADLWEPLLDEFTQQHPDIKVTHNVVPWANVDETFTAAFLSGDPPDVFYLPDEWYPKYVAQEQIADVTSLFGDLEGNYDPNVWSLGTYKGKLYGVPFLSVVHALVLNMNLFKAKGLPAPKTWDEIASAARELTDPSNGIYGMEYPTTTSWTYLVPLLASGGAGVLGEDLTEVVANTPGGVAAWEVALERIVAEDKSATAVSFTTDQLLDLSLKGQIAMMWAEQSQIGLFREQAPDLELDVMPLPAIPDSGGQPSVWTNTGFLFMGENSEHQDQAAELIRFLASKRVQDEYVVKGVNLMSPMKGVEPGEVDPVVAKFLSYLPNGAGPVISTHWSDAAEALRQESQAVATGQKGAEQALRDFEATVEPVLDGE